MRVCIVDDVKSNLMIIEKVVQQIGADVQVECFLDPVQALAHCSQSMPDLVMVDYVMPAMDGHQLVQELRLLPAAQDVPIVMVTAEEDRSVRQRALELGTTDFINKPIDPSEVTARLRNLLELRRNHRLLEDSNLWLAEQVRAATKAIADREEDLIIRLSRAAEYRDPKTGGHINRMAHFALLIAQHRGLKMAECDLIFRAAPMHDIGKMGIPDGVLLKQDRLTLAEIEVIKSHSEIGFAILRESESRLIKLGAEIALCHHEWFDGSGYPQGLKGDEIPLAAQIVAVADVFDALTSDRPYKPAWEMDRAHEYLKEKSGTQFDPLCVQAFSSAWPQIQAVRERLLQGGTPLMTH